jgi:hypothetical protein
MKIYKLSLIVLVLSSLLLVTQFIHPAAAQETGVNETFDNPQLPGWEHSPEVIVTEGVLRIAPQNFAARMGRWQDFDLSLKLQFSGPGETHVNYRASDQGSYLLLFTMEEIVLLRTTPGTSTDLAHASLGDISGADWIDVKINLSGSQHTILVNNTQVISADDPNPLPAGGVTFASHGERTSDLDDLTLTVIQGTVQPGVEQPGVVQSGGEPVPVSSPTPSATPVTGWQGVLDQVLSSNRGNPLELDVFAVNLLLAALTSWILSRVYVHWGASLSNRRKFAANFTLVTITTTFIILVVRSSVALSLGLVGALSIIRFRAAIKEPEELAYLFFAISLGIGLGDNQRLVTLLSMVVVIAVIGLARLFRQSQADVNLHLALTSRNPNKVELEQVMAVLQPYCSKLRLLRFDENIETVELSFVVEFHRTSDLSHARQALLALSPALEISFLDNKGVW